MPALSFTFGVPEDKTSIGSQADLKSLPMPAVFRVQATQVFILNPNKVAIYVTSGNLRQSHIKPAQPPSGNILRVCFSVSANNFTGAALVPAAPSSFPENEFGTIE